MNRVINASGSNCSKERVIRPLTHSGPESRLRCRNALARLYLAPATSALRCRTPAVGGEESAEKVLRSPLFTTPSPPWFWAGRCSWNSMRRPRPARLEYVVSAPGRGASFGLTALHFKSSL